MMGKPLNVQTGAILFTSVLAISSGWCGPSARAADQPDKAALSADKDQAGWMSLFDGKTMAGWKSPRFRGEGKVYVKDGAVVMEKGEAMTGIVYTHGDFPKMNYEVSLEGKRIDGNDFFCTTTFPVGQSHCSFVVGGWGGSTVGLSSINSTDASANETSTSMEFQNDLWYRIRIRVSRNKIVAWIDEKKMVDLETENRRISIRIECSPCKPFGIATWCTSGAVRNLRVRALTEVEKEQSRSSSAETAADRASPDHILLKDYRPQVIYKVPRKAITRARFPVIDMHAHPRYARTPEQVDRWVRTMDDLGLDQTVLLAGTTRKDFDQVVAQYAKHRLRFYFWCGFDLTDVDKPGFGPSAVAELERCFRAGATGVGELVDKGGGLSRNRVNSGVHIDDARLDPLLKKCAELGLPINIHVGEPIWMYQPMDRHNDGMMNALEWRLDNKNNILGHADVVATLERAVKKHPRTTFIACHFANCCYDLSILGRMLDTYPNLYADCGARYAETATIPRYMAKFFERYQDRLLYGTDMGQNPEMYLTTFRILETDDEHFYDWDLFTYHWPLHGFGLSDTILKKIYRENALKILKGGKPRSDASGGGGHEG